MSGQARRGPPRVVIVDNYDSYTFNLYQRLGELTGARAHVVRNDRVSLSELEALSPTHVILSPGPGSPEDPARLGVGREAVLELDVPILGICLGHQAIAHAFGAKIVRGERAVHGKVSEIHHAGVGPFSGLPSPLSATRYHSLEVSRDALPSCLEVTAHTSDGVIMALSHRDRPLHGLQFHPESIGTPLGAALLARWLGVSDVRRVPLEGWRSSHAAGATPEALADGSTSGHNGVVVQNPSASMVPLR